MPKIDRYEQAKLRGGEWLATQVRADGSIDDPERGIFYARVPWALAVTGQTVAAQRHLRWLRQNMFTEQGDFAGRYPIGEPWISTYASYPLALLVFGAHLLRQFDISYRGMRYLLTYRDQATGGYFNRRADRGSDGEQELFPSAQAGLCCLATGYLEEARLTAGFLRTLWEVQPAREDKFYYVFSKSEGPITRFAEGDAYSYVVDASRKEQPWANVALGVVFLLRLYMATREQTYLDLAHEYQNFMMKMSPSDYEWPGSCKVGWSSGLMYQVTRNAEYRKSSEAVADSIVEDQQADGHWNWMRSDRPASDFEPYQNTWETSEYIVYLDGAINSLASCFDVILDDR